MNFEYVQKARALLPKFLRTEEQQEEKRRTRGKPAGAKNFRKTNVSKGENKRARLLDRKSVV